MNIRNHKDHRDKIILLFPTQTPQKILTTENTEQHRKKRICFLDFNPKMPNPEFEPQKPQRTAKNIYCLYPNSSPKQIVTTNYTNCFLTSDQ